MEEQPTSISLEDHESKELPSDLSPEKLNQLPNVVSRLVHEQIMHAGPLPAPETLAGYENILPGSAERILIMAERQQEHRQSIERTVISGNIRAQTLGVWFAFLLGFTGFCCGTAVIWHGQSLEGCSTVIASLAALVGTFVYGRREQRKEREAAEARDLS